MDDDDRTTQELMHALGDDFDRCHENLIAAIDQGVVDEHGNVSADYAFHARQLVRAFFAYIEGVTFSAKVCAAAHCVDNNVEITPQERFLAAEVDYTLDHKGSIIEQPAQIKLTKNLRFAFALTEKAHGIEPRFDPSSEWWSCLQKSIKVRDRLMHPRLPEDLDISGEEIIDVLKAKEGFEELLLGYPKPKLAAR